MVTCLPGGCHFQFIPLIELCHPIKCMVPLGSSEARGSGACLGWARSETPELWGLRWSGKIHFASKCYPGGN